MIDYDVVGLIIYRVDWMLVGGIWLFLLGCYVLILVVINLIEGV